MGEKEIRRKAQHRRRVEICVQDRKAGYGWSETGDDKGVHGATVG